MKRILTFCGIITIVASLCACSNAEVNASNESSLVSAIQETLSSNVETTTTSATTDKPKVEKPVLIKVKAKPTEIINVREAPEIPEDNYFGNVIKSIGTHDELMVEVNPESEEEFVKVFLSDETTGYVSREYINFESVKVINLKSKKTFTVYKGEECYYNEYFNPFTLNEGFKLKKEYILEILDSCEKELLSSFSTQYDKNNVNKAHNIALAATEISTVILDGENFNWFEVVGNTGEAEGYLEANTYIGNSVIPGFGGGVCQVSSTLYNAIWDYKDTLFKDIESHRHSMPVSYVDYAAGKDATVTDIGGGCNFIFQNLTGSDIEIKATAEDGTLTVELYKLIP